ncbi:MAG TPA: T9SS type A sorting domain-containing protein, partial [Bacteroidales bacterium]|nr:T9SS type A sorting domain-containing protein [Bacteroidales bacterium]
ITANGSVKEPGGPDISVTTGVKPLNETGGIIVYPNPVSDFITLQLSNVIPGNDYIITITSITGNKVQEKPVTVTDGNQKFVLQTDYLPAGTYLITISGNNYSYKSKFIKLK